jgi:ABC-type sugar transport system ATPase subunit
MSVVELKNITKYFPGVKALDDVSFKMHGGKVTAFLGENGAGKSTLLKIINGDYSPSSGTYFIDGEEKYFKNPKEAIDAGISMIYQERQILTELSVAENVFLGMLPTKRGIIDKDAMIKRTQEIINEFELDINPREKVKNLSIAYQQMVEIMKAYNRDSLLIAFDEPTASLSEHEINVLFSIINKLRDQGKIIAYVTHRMSELDIIADDIVVFKDGRLVGVRKKGKVTPDELIKMMVGRKLGDIFNNLKRTKNIGHKVLEVKNLSNEKSKNASFDVKRGEVLGLSGLVGSGRTELIRSVIGADQKDSGEVYLNGELVQLNSVRDSLDSGIVLVSEDRKSQGIIPNLSVGKNITVSMLDQLSSIFSVINKNKEKEISVESIQQFNIRTPDQDKLISELSGGNQQKALLARAYNLNPSVFILDEPTKGIDVGAKFEIYQMIYDLTDRGISVIVISSELPEVIGISDRILVMKDGEITAVVNKKDATEELLLNKAMLG